ncbi:hypothetical protein Ndes2526B_g00451 [Nannochloris sp. 'desiccata']|nr:hypothetical protein KSW81_003222 [Chlorella desiccata (nom. nud.)]KAH7625070.1 hypothetical protein NADE_002288 [Chlorella desiccata (nom. nud.)]
MSQLGLRLEESDSSSSSDDEDHQLSIAEAYTVLDIRSGLLNPSRYCTAVQELKAVIQSLYKRRESTKEFKKNVEADVQTAIYEYHGGDFRSTDLRVLMLAVKNTLPQAKAQTLSREYKQKMLQVIRDTKKEERRRQQQQEEEKEAHQNARYSFANLPAECLETIFSHVEDPTPWLVQHGHAKRGDTKQSQTNFGSRLCSSLLVKFWLVTDTIMMY